MSFKFVISLIFTFSLQSIACEENLSKQKSKAPIKIELIRKYRNKSFKTLSQEMISINQAPSLEKALNLFLIKLHTSQTSKIRDDFYKTFSDPELIIKSYEGKKSKVRYNSKKKIITWIQKKIENQDDIESLIKNVIDLYTYKKYEKLSDLSIYTKNLKKYQNTNIDLIYKKLTLQYFSLSNDFMKSKFKTSIFKKALNTLSQNSLRDLDLRPSFLKELESKTPDEVFKLILKKQKYLEAFKYLSNHLFIPQKYFLLGTMIYLQIKIYESYQIVNEASQGEFDEDTYQKIRRIKEQMDIPSQKLIEILKKQSSKDSEETLELLNKISIELESLEN